MAVCTHNDSAIEFSFRHELQPELPTGTTPPALTCPRLQSNLVYVTQVQPKVTTGGITGYTDNSPA